MDTYVLKITSSRGVPLDYLCKEIEMIADKHLDGNTKIQLVPALDCIWMRSDSHQLRSALLKDNDFIISA